MTRPKVSPLALLGGSLLLAAGAGAAFAAGTSSSGSPTPTRTVTVNVGAGTAGPSGPSGPSGPRGPSGGFDCADGYEPGVLVIDHPGGHVKIFTCLQGH